MYTSNLIKRRMININQAGRGTNQKRIRVMKIIMKIFTIVINSYLIKRARKNTNICLLINNGLINY